MRSAQRTATKRKKEALPVPGAIVPAATVAPSTNGVLMKRKYFGTDGIRGQSNLFPMTPDLAMRVGIAVGTIFRRGAHRHRVVIGKDTRLSGYMFESALAAGIVSMGADVWLTGPLPTPGIAFITASMRCDAGVAISASHNPFEDNGIKVFARDGYKLPLDAASSVRGSRTGELIARCMVETGTSSYYTALGEAPQRLVGDALAVRLTVVDDRDVLPTPVISQVVAYQGGLERVAAAYPKHICESLLGQRGVARVRRDHQHSRLGIDLRRRDRRARAEVSDDSGHPRLHEFFGRGDRLLWIAVIID